MVIAIATRPGLFTIISTPSTPCVCVGGGGLELEMVEIEMTMLVVCLS